MEQVFGNQGRSAQGPVDERSQPLRCAAELPTRWPGQSREIARHENGMDFMRASGGPVGLLLEIAGTERSPELKPAANSSSPEGSGRIIPDRGRSVK
jgi:hypothetical protein